MILSLKAICQKNIIKLLESKRYALKSLFTFFKAIIFHRKILLEILTEFYHIDNFKAYKQIKEDNQYKILLWLEEEDPLLTLYTNHIWKNFLTDLNSQFHYGCPDKNENEAEMILNIKYRNTLTKELRQMLTEFINNETKVFKVAFLNKLNYIEQKKKKAKNILINSQRKLDENKQMKGIILLNSIEDEKSRSQQKKVSRSKLYKKSLNEHKVGIKKFTPSETFFKTNENKDKQTSSKSQQKIKRVKL
ncbi:hypothetical protein ACO0R3_001843 [Hanseniaspora guilliermondii]